MVVFDPTEHPLGIVFRCEDDTYLWHWERECFLVQFGPAFLPVDASEVPDVVRELVSLMSSVSLTLRLDPTWFRPCQDCGTVESFELHTRLDGYNVLLRECACGQEMLPDVLKRIEE